jgi:hypothetical protein
MTDTIAGSHGKWLDAYRRAWIERNAAAARELFTSDAVYREQPFDPPFAGAEAIAGYWSRVTATQRDIQLRYGRSVAEGNRVAVEWWATFVNDNAPVTLAVRWRPNRRCGAAPASHTGDYVNREAVHPAYRPAGRPRFRIGSCTTAGGQRLAT